MAANLAAVLTNEGFHPNPPKSLVEAGLVESTVEQLVLKILYFRGEVSGRELSKCIALAFSLVEPIVEAFRRSQFIHVKRSLGMGAVSSVYALTELGRKMALEALSANQYAGAAPVTLDAYTDAVEKQTLKSGWLTMPMLREAYKHMIVKDDVFHSIGPAINSSKSLLIYGQPGNGKTYLAEALMNLDSAPIYVPHAIEHQGRIITVYDPVYHRRAAEDDDEVSVIFEAAHDRRWVACKRPFIVTGGELTMDMVDLSYNQTSKVFDAPFQTKANNGIYLIDDFGRQRATPAEVLNRWIIPMEKRVDYLNFQTGGKIAVPFRTFLIFSTNLAPHQLGDEAFLRRIEYKMLMRSPDVIEFQTIFDNVCRTKKLECAPEVRDAFLERRYLATKKAFRRCQPRDVLTHVAELIAFEGLEMVVTAELLDHAFDSCFAQEDMQDS
jgi:predicted ATPase with chaperone activity